MKRMVWTTWLAGLPGEGVAGGTAADGLWQPPRLDPDVPAGRLEAPS
jgi:hypothetical protein